MKKGVIGLSLALSLSLIPAYSATPPKAGSVCSKQGTTKKYQGKKFTCIKAGKRLMWDKGKSLSTPQPKTSSTSASNANPSSSPSATQDQSFAERWKATGSAALTTLESAFPVKPPAFPKVDIVWRVSDSVNSKIKDEITKQYQENADFWSAYARIDGQLQVIIGTLDDIEFVCKWRDTHLQMNDQNCVRSFRTDKSRVWDAHTTQGRGRATDFYFMTDPAMLTEINFLPRVAHEFFHNVQHASSNSYKSILPCWAEESAAEHFGTLVSSNGNAEKYLKVRYSSVVRKSFNFRNSITGKDFWRNWLNQTDVTSSIPNSGFWGCQPFQALGLYGSGLLAAEYLHLQLGIPGVLTLYREAGNIGWDKAIEKAFGKSKSVIYDEIAEYMNKEYTIAAGQDWARPRCSPQGSIIQCAGGL